MTSGCASPIKHFHIQQLLRKSYSILPLVYISNSSSNPIKQTSLWLAIENLQGQQRSHIHRVLIGHTKFWTHKKPTKSSPWKSSFHLNGLTKDSKVHQIFYLVSVHFHARHVWDFISWKLSQYFYCFSILHLWQPTDDKSHKNPFIKMIWMRHGFFSL